MSRSSSADSGGVVDRQQEEPGPVFLYLDGRYESQDCRPHHWSQGQAGPTLTTRAASEQTDTIL